MKATFSQESRTTAGSASTHFFSTTIVYVTFLLFQLLFLNMCFSGRRPGFHKALIAFLIYRGEFIPEARLEMNLLPP